MNILQQLFGKPKPPPVTQADLLQAKEQILMKVSELKAIVEKIRLDNLEAFDEITAKLTELNAKITSLEEQLGDADVPDDAAATITQIAAIGKELADIIPGHPGGSGGGTEGGTPPQP